MSNNNCESDKYRLQRFEKNKYFYGKLMTVQDFEAEQSYFDGKNQLINRLLHGSGLVCGFNDLNIGVDKDGKLTINFIDGGIALDCCGREIVVPADDTSGIPIVDSEGNSVLDLTPIPYLYLKYNISYDGYVAAASKSSSCEEKCCPRRIVEDFVVIASHIAPDPNGIICRPELTGESEKTIEIIIREWLHELEKAHISCPSYEKTLKYKIFLGKAEAEGDGFKVETWDTEKYRIFFTQKELYQLLKCHILDFKNPHQVTASQIGALVTVDEVKGDQSGNVDLVQENSISITHKTANSITIGETHSAKKDNPHEVTASQIGALVSVNEVKGDQSGNVKLVERNAIEIKKEANSITIGETHSANKENPHEVTAKQTGALVSVNEVKGDQSGNVKLIERNAIEIKKEANSITIGEIHSVNKKNPHEVTAKQTGALVSVDGVKGDSGGNIDLIAGTNITITKPADFTIQIASTGGSSPGESVKSVGVSINLGTSDKYSREDHVHDLEKGVVDFKNLSETLQHQLNLLYMYLRERALKCTVSSFKAAWKELEISSALNIFEVTRKAVDNRIYENGEDFISFVGGLEPDQESLLELMTIFAEDIKTNFPDYAEIINKLLGEFKEPIDSRDALQVAILQDEVCFYVTELERMERQ